MATITNRMMPLLFPSDDTRAVPAVIDHSLEIMQPPPLHMSTDRLTDLGSLELAADRAYFDRKTSRHALVLLSDLDSDSFSLSGTLALLRRHRIEPFVIRVARPGERIYDSSREAEPYNPISSLGVRGLRAAHWHAYEEASVTRALRDLRAYLGTGPERSRGSTETQRNLAAFIALGALLVVAGICAPSLHAGIAGFRRAPGERRRELAPRRGARGDRR